MPADRGYLDVVAAGLGQTNACGAPKIARLQTLETGGDADLAKNFAHMRLRIGDAVGVRDDGPADADNAVTVAVTQVVVIVPDCTPPTPARGERPNIIMGCTNESNLAHMIANPRDLSIGRDIGPADGEALALGNERYRKGEITPLVEEQTRNTE